METPANPIAITVAKDPIAEVRRLLLEQVRILRERLQALTQEHLELSTKLARAERSLAALDEGAAEVTPLPAGVTRNQFRGKRLAFAICEYLEMIGRPASLYEVAEAMRQGGADHGKRARPLSTLVKIAVSTNPKILQMAGEMIHLLVKPGAPS